MAAGEIDIDAVVREVLARLRTSVDPAATQRTTLELEERLVTLATLENRLPGVEHVVLRAGAVVTPAAQDRLRAAGMRLSFAAPAAAPAGAGLPLVLGVADLAPGACDVAALIRRLGGKGIAVEQVAQTGLGRVVAELCDSVTRGGMLAVLLTRSTAAAACLANRTPGVRAVGGADVAALRRGIDELGANLLAIEPCGDWQLAAAIEHFCRHWPRPCPSELATHLEVPSVAGGPHNPHR